MKRPKIARRRDRKSGQSPYERHAKAPYRYSSQYYEWFKSVTKRVANSQTEG